MCVIRIWQLFGGRLLEAPKCYMWSRHVQLSGNIWANGRRRNVHLGYSCLFARNFNFLIGKLLFSRSTKQYTLYLKGRYFGTFEHIFNYYKYIDAYDDQCLFLNEEWLWKITKMLKTCAFVKLLWILWVIMTFKENWQKLARLFYVSMPSMCVSGIY